MKKRPGLAHLKIIVVKLGSANISRLFGLESITYLRIVMTRTRRFHVRLGHLVSKEFVMFIQL